MKGQLRGAAIRLNWQCSKKFPLGKLGVWAWFTANETQISKAPLYGKNVKVSRKIKCLKNLVFNVADLALSYHSGPASGRDTTVGRHSSS